MTKSAVLLDPVTPGELLVEEIDQDLGGDSLRSQQLWRRCIISEVARNLQPSFEDLHVKSRQCRDDLDRQ